MPLTEARIRVLFTPLISPDPSAIKRLLTNLTPNKLFVVPDKTEVQPVRPSGEVIIVPLFPTATKRPVSLTVTLVKLFIVGDIIEVHSIPSREVVITPPNPTATNRPVLE